MSTDVNGVFDGSLIDKAARWLEERNGYPIPADFRVCKKCSVQHRVSGGAATVHERECEGPKA